MKKFIEVAIVPRENVPAAGYTTIGYKRLIDLKSVSTIYEKSAENVIKLDDETCFSVSAESYNAVRDALLNGALGDGGTIGEIHSRIEDLETHHDGGNNIADKLCELQHDHTWIKQAVCNLTAMMKKENTGYKPALLIGCNDKDLDALFSACYEDVRKMQERIKELERQVEIMTEPKKPQ